MPLEVAIIIPTYNEEKNIAKTLQNAKRQRTTASFDVVVVDGKSTDRTVEIAQKYVKVLKSPVKDKAYQLNYGAAHTNSEIIVFLDADTSLPDYYVERIIKTFHRDPDLWVCGGEFSYIGSIHGLYYPLILFQALFAFAFYAFFYSIWVLLLRLWHAPAKIIKSYYFFNQAMFIYYFLKQMFNYTELSGTNICVRRKIFNEIGGFQKPAKLGVDWLFCHIVHTHIRKKGHGKIRMILSLIVETDVRHLTLRRSIKRFKTHSDFRQKTKKE